MYWYMSVQDFVRSTYQYVLVRTWNKTRTNLIHPGSAPRVNCNSVQLLCKRYDRMTSNFKKCKVQVTQVHTGTSLYWYILVRTGTDFNCTHASFWLCSTSFPTPASLHTTLGVFHAHSVFLQCSLLHTETTQAGLAAPKHPEPSVDLIHIAATPAMSICCVSAAHGEGRPLVLAELVWECRCRVTSQKQGNEYWWIIKTIIHQYMMVHTRMYQYVLVCTGLY
jgi:hypothetical protein